MTSSAASHLPLFQRLAFYWKGFYATRVYLPFSILGQSLRRLSRKLRGKVVPHEQQTKLSTQTWSQFVAPSRVGLLETEKQNGNVRVSEVGVLAQLASACPDQGVVFEIGTFDGRTSLNLAFNAPMSARIHTLDLPKDLAPAMELEAGEGHMVDKPVSGARIDGYRSTQAPVVERITQHHGDSATYDFSAFKEKCSLFFVDGSHSYDYLLSDTRVAMEAIAPGGVIVWHDYGVWKGVTKGLEELEDQEGLGLKNIRGTSLVVWRKPSN